MMTRNFFYHIHILVDGLPGTVSLRRVLLGALLLAVLHFAGCSFEEDTLQQALYKAQRATAGAKTSEMAANTTTRFDSDGLINAAGLLDSQEAPEDLQLPSASPTVPFPDRLNPFEFGAGIDFDAPQTRDQDQLEIKLYGFIGNAAPQAILSVDGRTKTLGSGEKWGALEIIEVKPPTVRIKVNQVIRVWSLLGNSSGS